MNTSHTFMRKAVLFLVLLLSVALVATPGSAQGPGEQQAPEGDPTGAPTAGGIVHGAFIAPIIFHNTEITAYNERVGKDAGFIKVFYPWDLSFDDGNCGYFAHLFGYADQRGCGGRTSGPIVHPVVMLTWEPLANPTNFPSCQIIQNGRTRFEAITNGSCDGYIDDFARRLKGWSETHGDRFMIRFAHEMNIASNPWWRDDPAYPALYKQAFRHLHNRFVAVGAKPYAQFIWSPNNRSFSGPNRVDAWNAIPNYYPGDQYVDWIGLSGFNWYTNQDQPWYTFRDLFESPDPLLGNKGVLSYLHCNYAKPIMLAEWGTVEGPGGAQSKAAWVTDAYTRLKDFPFIKAVGWFDYYDHNRPQTADFRVTAGSYTDPNPLHIGYRNPIGSPTDAYTAALRDPAYISTMPTLAEVTPASTYCGTSFPPVTAISVPAVAYGQPGRAVNIPISMEIASGTYRLELSGLPAGYTYGFSPSQLGNGTTTSQLTINIPGNAQVGAALDLTLTASGTNVTTASFRLNIVGQMHTVYLPTVTR